MEVRAAHPGLTDLVVEIAGARESAISYDDLTGRVRTGDRVMLNTTAVALGLGTGGVHFVVAVERDDDGPPLTGHAMKLRYTPLQTSVDAVEDAHRDLIDSVTSLDGLPVVIAGLHSALAPAVIGARATAPDARIVYVMTDAGALPIAFSRTVPALRAAGLLDVTITAGQAVGGDLEAITLYGALAAARALAHADVIVVAMGPGNLGVGSRWGSAALHVADVINAADAMGARAIVAPRVSFADPRERHRGVSHHTRTALSLARAPAEIALPPLAETRASLVRAQLAAALGRHALVEVGLGAAEEILARAPVDLRSMGRGFVDDPDYFRAAAAAAVLALR